MTEKRLFVGRKKCEDRFTIITDYDDEIGVKETRSGDALVLKHSDLNAQQFVAQLVVFLNDQNQTIVDLYDGSKYWSDKATEKIKELLKENEQLKETINELRDMDKEKDIEIEHINNIYKEFGFKGIINYAKDKLQDYGTVREVGNGLWLLATGGWSDNEFWLDCLLNWNFMYAKGHYRATTSGGGYYYTETPYEDIEIKKKQIKG